MDQESIATQLCPDCNLDKPVSDFTIAKRVNPRCNRCQNNVRNQKRKMAMEKAKDTTKVCKSCHVEKNGTEFEFGTLWCKPCFSEKDKEANHRPTTEDPDKNCRICELVKPATSFRKRELVCKECNKQKLYKWREENKERFLEICKTYREKEDKKALRRQYLRDKYKNDIESRLLQLYRTRVRECIKKRYYPKNKHFEYEKLLGCNWDMLVSWLEYNMKPEMSWENYGTYWHVDHIQPCARFDFSEDKNRQKCFNWANLAPLEAIENLKKSDSIDEQMIEYYKEKAIQFISERPNLSILTDALPEEFKTLVTSGVLPTKESMKIDSGSEEKSEVR